MTCKIANDERLAKKVTTASGTRCIYFHPDHLGSTSIVSDESGNLVEKTEYYPYGGVKQGGSEQYLFTGKELDKGTGLYYYGARYYSPELMRFTQPDNIIQDAYDPQSLNRYAYVRNNPLKYVDPSGNQFVLMAGLEYITDYTLTGEKITMANEIPDPESPIPSQHEYLNQKRWEAPFGLAFAVGDSILNIDRTASEYAGEAATETVFDNMGKDEAKNLNRLSFAYKLATSDRVQYNIAQLFVAITGDDNNLEKFYESTEYLPFGIPSYKKHVRMSNYNPHTSTGFIPYSRWSSGGWGGGGSYSPSNLDPQDPGYEPYPGYWDRWN